MAEPSIPGMRRAYVGLGANQGDARTNLQAACGALNTLEQSRVVALSPLYRSAPVDAEGGDFTNAVIALDTGLDPYALLLHLGDIELRLGRRRRPTDPKHSAPRPIDLDLLLVGNLVIRSTPLDLPHPRMHLRAFVLHPLLDLDPDIHIPGLGPTRPHLALISGQAIERIQDPTWSIHMLERPAPQTAPSSDGASPPTTP
jgi:2-amino-4-hydroxy-6-hydroxymethyldihydropteridine diphosphokinase